MVVEARHLKHMLDKLDHFPTDRGENKQYFETPPRNVKMDLLSQISQLLRNSDIFTLPCWENMRNMLNMYLNKYQIQQHGP